MPRRREPRTWRATLLVLLLLLCVPGLGAPGCGSGGSSSDPDPTPLADATGLRVANASTSCCGFVGVDVVDLATGLSQVTSGLDVQPGETSEVLDVAPGSYTLRVLRDATSTPTWTDAVPFAVTAGRITRVTVDLELPPPPMPTGLIVANDPGSCCRFVAVDIIDEATGASTITGGLNVQPGQSSPLFPLIPGRYAFRVQQDRGGTLTWIAMPSITVIAGAVATATAVLT